MNEINFLQPRLVSRRQMLGMSGMGMGSVALAALMHSDAVRADQVHFKPRMDLLPSKTHFPARAKAVIQLVMTGGPSQMDLFDPKPELQQRHDQVFEIKIDAFQRGSEANRLMASPFKFRKVGQSGMNMSECLTHLPDVADDICLIRSQVGVHNNHTEGIINLGCGKMFLGRPTLGAWVSYGLGTENRDLPAFVVLRDPKGYSTSGGLMSKNGWMPAIFGGTEFNTTGPAVRNLQPSQSLPRGVRRRSLEFLAQLNTEHRRNYPYNSELESRIKNYELAARMQLTASRALDLSTETRSTRQLYGLDNTETASYGTRCLMARRLVETGVRFIQVFSGKGQPWDHHNGLSEGLPDMCDKTDLATTGLIKDLKQRGLLDSTIVVWAGEFGRMPVAQNGTGRDHNKHAGSFFLAGGGFKGGITHGTTDDVGYTVVEDPVTVPDMFACILHQLGLDHTRLQYFHSGRFENSTDDAVTGAYVHPQIIDTPIYA
jgi:hypothetical protein